MRAGVILHIVEITAALFFCALYLVPDLREPLIPKLSLWQGGSAAQHVADCLLAA